MFKKTFVILMLIVVIFGLLFLNLRKDEKTEILAQAASYSAPCTGACGSAQCQGVDVCPPEENCSITACSGVPNACPARPQSNLDPASSCSCQTIEPSPTCTCSLSVVEGSKVLMANGNYKNIEDIKAGDYIKSFNTETQEFINARVKETSQHQEEGYLIINSSLKVTETHYIYLDKTFQEAKNAKPGSFLLNEKGQEVEIFSIEVVSEKVFTYHLSVDCQNNFFAGGYLVHNETMCVGDFLCSAFGNCNYTCQAGWVNCDGQAATGCECETGAGYACTGGVCDPPACPSPQPTCPCPSNYTETEYKCGTNDCNGTILRRTRDVTYNCWGDCVCVGGSWDCSSCGNEKIEGAWTISTHETCGDFKKCEGSTDWSSAVPIPSCECSGSCYPAPTPKPLNDASLSPQNVADGGSYKLPINFGWEDDVETAAASEGCQVLSYEFNIVGTGISEITTITQLQTVNDQSYKLECQLETGNNYEWQVRACSDASGTDCGQWSAPQPFDTSHAVEPILPYDPDWAGLDEATPYWDESKTYPVEFSWCEVSVANSYRMNYWREGVPHCPVVDCDENYNYMIIGPNPTTTIRFDIDSFTKGNSFEWVIAACSNNNGTGCGTPSQMWSFTGTTTLAKVDLRHPQNNGCANFHSNLEWVHVGGARSYTYSINPSSITNATARDVIISFEDIWSELALDTLYSWEVKACWDDDGLQCEDDSLSDTWQFTITGATPTGLDVTEKDPDDGRAVIPIKLKWDDVPCAASYKYELTGGSITIDGITPSSNLIIKYDPAIQHPQQNTNYLFSVSTCAKIGGEECGSTTSENFTTFELRAPQNPHPPDGGDFYTYENYLNWKSVLGGAYYQYEVTHVDTGYTIGPNIVKSSNVFFDHNMLDSGIYNWWVKACIDENCNEEGASSTWTFTLVEGGVPGGLIPCGRYANNPDTPWNERHPCGVEHVFIMIYLIISYVLWKLIPIALVLLVIASAIIFYFSGQLGIPEPTAQVKSIWKAVGIGLLIVFLAWIITSVILGLLGYKVGIFGTWWILDF